MNIDELSYPENATLIPLKQLDVDERSREDYGDVKALAESIKTYGIIHPPCVIAHDTDSYTLIAGGRRTKAMILLGLDSIPVNIRTACDDGMLAELELEENLQRKDLHWWESVLIIEKAHRKYTKEALQLDSDWGNRQTGELMGVSHVHVAHALTLAREIMTGNAELKNATSVKQAYRILLQQREDACEKIRATSIRQATKAAPVTGPTVPPIAKPPVVSIADILDGQMDGLANALDVQPITVETDEVIDLSSNFKIGDSVTEILPQMPDECFDHIVTDPPYGININEDFMVDNDSIAHTHKVKDNVDMFEPMFQQFYRTLRTGGFCVVWFDLKYYEMFISLAESVGFQVNNYPIMWSKAHKCRNMSGNTGFTKQYETALVCRKGSAVMNIAGESNIVIANGLLERQKYSNPFSKPLTVWQHIINAISTRGQIIADPFGGQFSCPLACLASGRQPWACEIDDKHFNAGINHIKDFYLALSDNKVTFS